MKCLDQQYKDAMKRLKKLGWGKLLPSERDVILRRLPPDARAIIDYFYPG